jgi:hypothetical protein
MVALSLTNPIIPQKKKGDNKTEKSHDPFRASNNVHNSFCTYLHDIMLHLQQRLGVTR